MNYEIEIPEKVRSRIQKRERKLRTEMVKDSRLSVALPDAIAYRRRLVKEAEERMKAEAAKQRRIEIKKIAKNLDMEF
jgi:hypothetical protein